METAAVVAEGERMPKGEDSGVSVAMLVTIKGAGSLGLFVGSWPVGDTLVGVGAGVRTPAIMINPFIIIIIKIIL
jgi:hypothetical protein